MTVVRTFLDARVLITAARGTKDDAETALQLLKSPKREFVASQFLKLEELPKALFNQRTLEAEFAEFYEVYFEAVTRWANDIQQLSEASYREATDFGLGAMNALYVAAAVAAVAYKFITSEKSTKSIYRTHSISVISL